MSVADWRARSDAVFCSLKERVRGRAIHRLIRRFISRHETVSPALLRNEAYDHETVEVMTRVLRPDQTGIDVGAYDGAMVEIMVRIAPAGIHYAFEPLPHLAEELRARFPNVRVSQVAVCDRTGISEFQYVRNDPGYSGLRRRIYDRPDAELVTIQVATTTLDDAIPANQRVAFIKLDIEGAEYHALKGAIQTLKRWRPVVVFEAGIPSTGEYGVTADDVFTLVVTNLRYELSTMRRWLQRGPPYSREEFRYIWERGLEFYFIATPAES